MKCFVETELKLDNGSKKKYIGRFVGFLTDDEYRKMVGNPEISSRIETKPTKALLKSCDKVNEENWGLNSIRFVLVIRKIDGITTMKKLLLISDKLNYIAEIKPDAKEVMFVTTKGELVTMKEKESLTE